MYSAPVSTLRLHEIFSCVPLFSLVFLTAGMNIVCLLTTTESWSSVKSVEEHTIMKRSRIFVHALGKIILMRCRANKKMSKIIQNGVIKTEIPLTIWISGGGVGFVKKDFYSNRWFEVGDEKARDKVGTLLFYFLYETIICIHVYMHA